MPSSPNSSPPRTSGAVAAYSWGSAPWSEDWASGRPAQEPPSAALRHMVWCFIDACAGHADRALRVVQLILGTPALLARFLERQAQWRDELAAEVARRLDLDPATELYPHLAAGTALTAFHTVLQRWSDSGGTEDPAALTDRAFAVLAPALDAVVRSGAPADRPSPS